MILRRLARPMLAGIFVYGGLQALRAPDAHAEATKPLLHDMAEKANERLPLQVPTDPTTLVKVDAMVKIGAGLALAAGRFPRLSAMLLAGSLVPTTAATHRFWEEKDANRRQQQLLEFLKNAGLLGGLLLASADTAGKPSLGWRARRATRTLQHRAHDLGEWAADTTGTVSDAVAGAPKQARKALSGVLPG